MGIDKQTIINMVHKFTNQKLIDTEFDLYNTPRPDSTIFALELDDIIETYQKHYGSKNYSLVSDELEQITSALNINSNDNNIKDTIARLLLNGHIDNLKTIREKLEHNQYNKPKSSKKTTSEKKVKNVSVESKKTIKELSNEYLTITQKAKQWSKDTLQLNIRTMNVLNLYFKDKDIKSIKYNDLLDWRDILFELPNGFQALNQFKNKDLDYILDNNDDMNRLSNNTMNKYIMRANQFFNFCYKHDYIDKELKLEYLKDSANNGRERYIDDEVKKILELAANDTKENYYILLLAAYQGMRLKEITQLTKSDIIVQNDIHCISINNNDDKTTKNKSSIRIIPIHQKVVELGFLNYVQNSKVANLFSISNKQFTSYFRSKYKNKINENKTLYCLRHSFIDTLIQSKCNTEHVAQFVGHTTQYKMTMTTYASRLNVNILNELLEHINYI